MNTIPQLEARIRSARFYRQMYARWPGKQGAALYARYRRLELKLEKELAAEMQRMEAAA